jgi:hypothetical protein
MWRRNTAIALIVIPRFHLKAAFWSEQIGTLRLRTESQVLEQPFRQHLRHEVAGSLPMTKSNNDPHTPGMNGLPLIV